MKKSLLFFLLSAILGAFSYGQQRVIGDLLVQLHPGVEVETLIRDFEMIDGKSTSISVARSISAVTNMWQLHFDESQIDADMMLRMILRSEDVINAQFNYTISYRANPNDPLYSSQWQYDNTGQNGGTPGADIDANLAWNITTGGLTVDGDTIVVAIIDDGINPNHPDISANLWRNRHEIAGNGIDDDLNGYVDDVLGWNTYNSPMNDDITGGSWGGSHGTPVAGIVGAKGDNGVGVAGVNWNVKLMIIVGGGDQADALTAYGYVLASRKQFNETNGEKGAFIVSTNASWGIDFGQPSAAPLWCSMYDTLGVYGVLNCGATINGNQNVDVVGDLPTACPSEYLISVTNMNRFNNKVNQAGYGLTTIDLGAFGESTYTLTKNNYGGFGGTSGATPHVTGAIALAYAAACPNFMQMVRSQPDSAARAMRDFVLNGVSPNTSLSGITVTGGVLNLMGMLNELTAYCTVFGLEDDAQVELSIYPNPASSTLTLAGIKNSSFRSYIVYNVLGTDVVHGQLLSGENAQLIDISDLPAGMYLIEVVGAKKETHKFVKQ
jgi:serine protease